MPSKKGSKRSGASKVLRKSSVGRTSRSDTKTGASKKLYVSDTHKPPKRP